METIFVTALFQIRIPEDLGRGDKIDDVTFITNNRDYVRQLIPAEALPSMGRLETDALLGANAVIYSKSECPENVAPRDYLVRKLRGVLSFQHVMWLEKDNSVDNELGFLIYRRDGLRIDSNFLAVKNATARAQYIETMFSREELRNVRRIFKERFRWEEANEGPVQTRLERTAPRIARAFYLLQPARHEDDLALRIAMYCACLEAVFATSISELSHQLAERTAVFLSGDLVERVKIYRTVKKAYGVRSKAFHGDAFAPAAAAELPDLSVQCDHLLRRTFRKLLDSPELFRVFAGPSDGLDAYFLSKILGPME